MQDASRPSRGRLRTWASRRSRLAFWTTAVGALLIGIAVGGALTGDQAEADKARTDASRAQSQLAAMRSRLTNLQTQNDRLARERDSARSRASTAQAAVKKLSAKAELPDLTGADVDTARSNDLVDELGWKIRTTSRITTASEAGTVIAQAPREGTVLKSGRAITLIVAKKPPPKPKQWVTIDTLVGASSTKTKEFKVPSGVKARLTYSMPEDGNNAIILYRAPKEYVDLVLNEIGPQQGSTRLYEPGTFYLDVTGSYSIQVQVFKRP